jgi:hypothetical protein
VITWHPSFAEGFDDLASIADLPDSQAEILADFYGVAKGDNFVIDEKFEGLLAAFGEFDDGAGAEAHDFMAIHFSLCETDDERDLEAEDSVEFAGAGGESCGRWGV